MNIILSPHRILTARPRTEIWNGLVGYAGRSIPLVARNCTFTFQVVNPPAPHIQALLVQGGGVRAILHLKSFPFAALLGVGLQVETLQDLPPVLKEALLQGVLSLLWEVVPQSDRGDIQLLRVSSCGELIQEADGQVFEWFDVQLEGLANEPVHLTIGCSPLELVDQIALDKLAPQMASTTIAAGVELEGYYTIDSLALSISQLQALSIGDCIVIRKLDPSQTFLRIEDVLHEFQYTDTGWAYVAPKRLERSPSMPESLLRHLGKEWLSPAPKMEEEGHTSFEDHGGDASALEVGFEAEPEPEPIPVKPKRVAKKKSEKETAVPEPLEVVVDAKSPRRGRKKKGETPPASLAHAVAKDPLDVPLISDEVVMNSDLSKRQAAAIEVEKPDLSAIQIVVDVDLGRISVPLSEIERWRRGTMVPITPPDIENGAEVTIRANGHALAQGDLMMIDDRLVVRLNRVSSGE